MVIAASPMASNAVHSGEYIVRGYVREKKNQIFKNNRVSSETIIYP
jgi:hypothetical protein